MPDDRMEMGTIKAFVESAEIKHYRKYSKIECGPFEITVQTPTQTLAAVKLYEMDIAKDRKKREAKAGLPDAERYSEVRDYRDWGEYVGAPTTPVVSLAISPTLGETGGSLFKRLMLGPDLRATYKFNGDVRGAVVFRNGELVEPIRGGHTPAKVYVENKWVSLKDVADQGFYIYSVEILRPDSVGAPPSIVVVVRDLKNQSRMKCVELPADVVAGAWNDFESFYLEKRPKSGFARADEKAAKGRKSAYSSGFLKGECSWPRVDPLRP
jgi:hypothetical protein